MTIEEAIKILQDTPVYLVTKDREVLEKFQTARIMAIEALEKQIPDPVGTHVFQNWGNLIKKPCCPSCGSDLRVDHFGLSYLLASGGQVTYCDNCGQAIHWSDWSAETVIEAKE